MVLFLLWGALWLLGSLRWVVVVVVSSTSSSSSSSCCWYPPRTNPWFGFVLPLHPCTMVSSLLHGSPPRHDMPPPDTDPRLPPGRPHPPPSTADKIIKNNINHHHNKETTSTATKNTTKRLLCIRHGISIANEWMNQPGNQWGDANFRDNGQPDSPLSDAGRQQTQTLLREQFNDDDSTNNKNVLYETLKEVELVMVSPLTRCLQTFQYGVEPSLRTALTSTTTTTTTTRSTTTLPILAVPLLRERVYTTSDTGRCASMLSQEFPRVDFSLLLPHHHDDETDDKKDETKHQGCCGWWYTGKDDDDDGDDVVVEKVEEWRPHGENQWYGVPGEPEEVFDRRMKELEEWIINRPERTILIVSHWGVLQHLTNGLQFENAQAKVLVQSFCPIQGTSTITEL